ncbi:MAG TPA: AAA family ATPase [Ktedonobacteraceae bacterium]|nr:AAA family ATPase [Ktedonobacteraceae bacterium]
MDKPIICPTLIGRDQELAALRHLLKHTSSGQSQMLLLSGEAGIGKSRLVAELKISATDQGFHVLEGKCFPTDLTSPYAPLRDLLRSCFASLSPASIVAAAGPFARTLSSLLPEHVSLLPEMASLPPLLELSPEQEQRRLFATLIDFFIRQTEQRPLLLIVEDVHWSDDSSLEFLHTLARQMAGRPLLLLCTYRRDDVHPQLSRWLAQLDRERLNQEMTLAQLTRSETEAMLRAIFAELQMISGELLETLWTLTDGNPFFVEEVLRSGLSSGGITFTEGGWVHLLPAAARQVAIPRSVQDAVQQRVSHLSSQAQQLLTLAAVAGRRFDVRVLQHLLHCTDEELLLLLKEVMAAQLVVEESADQFSFRHALTRQAIYTGLLVRERRVVHRRLADTLERLFTSPAALDAHLADLAYHCFQGEDWEKARGYGQRAGEKALTLFALRAAVEQLSWAIQAASHLSESPPPSLHRARGQAYELLGEFERARADYEQVLHFSQEAHDGQMEWQGLSDLGFLWASRDYTQAGQFFRRALELAQALSEPRLQAMSLNRLGNWLVNIGQSTEGLQIHQQALQLFERQQDKEGMAETFDLLGMANALSGETVTAASQWGQAIELFRATGDTRSLVSALTSRAWVSCPWMGTTYSSLRTRDECVQDGEEALRLARQGDLLVALAYARLVTCAVTASFGEFGSALAHGHEALKLAREIGHQQWLVGASVCLGGTYVLMLEPTFALKILEPALPLASELGSPFWSFQIAYSLAQAYLLTHDPLRAEAALAAVLPREQRSRNLYERWVRSTWCELALAQGQPDQALQIAEELLETVPGASTVVGEQPIPWLLSLQGEALLALGHTGEAVQALEKAKSGALERQERSRLWYIHGLLARAYQQERQEEQARREVIAARNSIGALAATIDESALREQFTHTAHTTLWPREKLLSTRHLEAEQFGGLTEREREVAALLAQGKSNREIGALLVVHYRTIETHVSNILSKLGLTSRAQIALWAREKGLGH